MNDSHFISKTVALALKGKFNTKPGVNVGCVIVKNNKIIGQGFYEEYGGSHAEINAINDVKKNTKHPIFPNFLEAKYISLLSLAAKKAKPVPA